MSVTIDVPRTTDELVKICAFCKAAQIVLEKQSKESVQKAENSLHETEAIIKALEQKFSQYKSSHNPLPEKANRLLEEFNRINSSYKNLEEKAESAKQMTTKLVEKANGDLRDLYTATDRVKELVRQIHQAAES